MGGAARPRSLRTNNRKLRSRTIRLWAASLPSFAMIMPVLGKLLGPWIEARLPPPWRAAKIVILQRFSLVVCLLSCLLSALYIS
jgi:hypothetical protein